MALLALQAAAAGSPPAAGFCERLAPQLGMKAVTRGASRTITPEWKVNTLGGLGPALFGGMSVMSFSVRPIAPEDAADRARLEEACNPGKKGAICRIEGPARLTIKTRRSEAEVEAAPGERAEVEARGTTILCRPL